MGEEGTAPRYGDGPRGSGGVGGGNEDGGARGRGWVVGEIKARRLIRILLEKFPFPENALRAPL